MYLQRYDDDPNLERYFGDRRYAKNAMYITVHGVSEYIRSRIEGGWKEHDASTLLYDTHLHADGVERGVQPYGGYGRGASTLSIHGAVVPLPTLPQRDAYEYLMRPSRGETPTAVIPPHVTALFGTSLVAKNNDRISDLTLADKVNLGLLRKFLIDSDELTLDLLKDQICDIPKRDGMTGDEIKVAQRRFYFVLYRLILGQDRGPKLANLILELDKNKFIELLSGYALEVE